MSLPSEEPDLRWRDRALFLAFLLSGFCGLLYQIVWLRLAFASFGIITPVLSVVIAVFMLGLGLGSWMGGKWIVRLSSRFRISPLLVYAAAESLIGAWALLVPWLFDLGAVALLGSGETSSFRYLIQSAIAITAGILPACLLMGATFPLVTAYLQAWPGHRETSFSFLYLANVIGAMSGAVLTALVLIELLGFRGATIVGVAFNWVVAALSVRTSLRYQAPRKDKALDAESEAVVTGPVSGSDLRVLGILFLTGFVSLGMEVAWTRAFTPILTTTIYAFAFLLTSYLLATWVGSYAYRKQLALNRVLRTERLILWLALAAFLPLAFNDPLIQPTGLHVWASLFPICALLGYLTPKLIDGYSRGLADRMGFAYAVNIGGCILGPLLSGYVLLPAFGVRWTLILLAVPFVLLTCIQVLQRATPIFGVVGLAVLGVSTIAFIRTYEDVNPPSPSFQVRRDHTATVISYGEGMEKRLLVNGIGITHLSTITKVMAHLPLLSLSRQPESALVICFGMGTTFRSLLSWGIDATAVELVPGVRDAFGYYFADASTILQNPKATIVIDDGRRFLRRTAQQFDVITLDPPPPVEAAGSSLLYSREFYRDAKARLRDGGVLQQWFPGGETRILEAIATALVESFKYVRVFRSLEGWGFHFIASDHPVQMPTPAEALSELPLAAKDDLLEWSSGTDAATVLHLILSQEIPLVTVLPKGPSVALTDDRPYNEYFFIRRMGLDAVERDLSR